MTNRVNDDDAQEIFATLGPKTNPRQLTAFSAACCRRIWDQLGPESRAAVEAVEAWLEGRATDEDLAGAAQKSADALADAERQLDIREARNGHLYHAAFAAAACAWTPETRFNHHGAGRGRAITSPLEAASMAAAQAASARAIADAQHLRPIAAMHAAVHDAQRRESVEQGAILRLILGDAVHEA